MSKPKPFLVSAAGGMRQDEPRDALPGGTVWNLVDYLPEDGALATGRGGFDYASPDISAIKATASYIQMVGYAPFASGAKKCAIDEDGEFYTITTPTTATNVGAASTCLQTPFFYRQRLCIPNSNGTSLAKTYDGTSLSTFSASVAGSGGSGSDTSTRRGKYGATYKDRGILAGGATDPQRLFFTDAGAFTWNSFGYIDASGPVLGLAALRNAVLVFEPDKTERLRGATPPPGSDMILEPIFSPTCIDARSIVNYDEYAVFASSTGVHLTDGAVIQDLTKVAGMSSYWHSLMAGYTSTWTIAAGQFRNYYVVSVMDGPTFKDAFLLNLDKRTMVRVSNLPAVGFAHTVGTAPELYFADRVAARVGSLSAYFSTGRPTDADGTPVTPLLESAFTQLGGRIRIRDLYLKYDLAGSADPTLTLSYLTDPSSTSYTPLGAFAATDGFARKRLPVRQHSEGFGFKLAQTQGASSSKLYGVELDAYAEEASRVG